MQLQKSKSQLETQTHYCISRLYSTMCLALQACLVQALSPENLQATDSQARVRKHKVLNKVQHSATNQLRSKLHSCRKRPPHRAFHTLTVILGVPIRSKKVYMEACVGAPDLWRLPHDQLFKSSPFRHSALQNHFTRRCGGLRPSIRVEVLIGRPS